MLERWGYFHLTRYKGKLTESFEEFKDIRRKPTILGKTLQK